MDRADRIGYWVSGAAHAGLIGAALLGGALFRPQPLEAVRMAEVATMSEAEFQSLAAAAAGRGPVSGVAATTPAQPRPPAPENRAGAPEAVSPPAPDAQAAELSRPADRPEARPDLSDFAPPVRPVALLTNAPEPAEPAESIDLAALPQPGDRPDPARKPAQSPAPLPQHSALAPVESARPRGRPEGLSDAVQARRAAAEAARTREELLAREAAEAAADEAAAARAKEAAARRATEERAQDERREAEARKAEAEAARKADAAKERARREAEADAAAREVAEKTAAAEKRAAEKTAEAERRAAAEKEAAEQKAAAEKKAAERQAAEARARKAAEAKAEAEAAAEAKAEKAAAAKKAAAEALAEQKAREKAEAERKSAEAARKAALAEAKKDEGAGASGGGGAAANGPPLSQGEKDGFRVAVEACWNIGSLSSEAARTKVSVQFSMTPDGRVESKSLKMVGHSGGSDAAAKQAYEAARRAILRCQNNGYPLPAEKYNRWKVTIIDFNPGGGARIQ